MNRPVSRATDEMHHRHECTSTRAGLWKRPLSVLLVLLAAACSSGGADGTESAAGTATASTFELQTAATEQSRQAEGTQEALRATQVIVGQQADATATAVSAASTATALATPQLHEVAAGKPTAASANWANNPRFSFPSSAIVDRQTTEVDCRVGVPEGNTYWLLPNRQTGWVQIDLQRPYSIAKLRWLNTHNSNCNDRATTRFHIALSLTGAFAGEEAIVLTGPMAFSAQPRFQEFTLPEPVSAQYVRFYVDAYHNLGGGLNELEVYAQVNTP